MVAIRSRIGPLPFEYNPLAKLVTEAETLRRNIEAFVRHRDSRQIVLALLNPDDPDRKKYAEEIRVALQSAMFTLEAVRLALGADFGGRRWFDDATR